MAKGEREKSGGDYTASVRRKQKTRLKAKKHWSLRRVVSVLGFIAASLAVLAFASTFFPQVSQFENVFGRGLALIRDGRLTVNSFFAQFLNVPLPAPLIGIGDILIITVIVVLLLLLLRVAEPEYVRRIDEMVMVMRSRSEAVEKKEEAQADLKAETPASPPYPFPVPYPSQGTPVQTLQFSASAVINAPRTQVWEVLNQVVYVPTCGEILDSVEVLGKLANALTWEGTIRAGRKEFPVEGTTTLYPPTRMEVACHRGALEGFRGVLSLVDVPGGTRLTETVEFDPGIIPDEYAAVANALRAKGSEILVRDLEHFDQLVQALASPKGEPEPSE
ncbi:MAG: SRPBCC family protein [Candidatus Thermoplasmatota archaeon]|nr:SRPBCC family protein [Candidatus Thermoplasmatota archaeon]